MASCVVDVPKAQKAPAVRAKQKLLLLDKSGAFGFTPDLTQFRPAMRTKGPHVSWGFHEVQFLLRCHKLRGVERMPPDAPKLSDWLGDFESAIDQTVILVSC
jgi:hypothetical protein